MFVTTPVTLQLTRVQRAKLRKERLSELQREQRREDKMALLRLAGLQQNLLRQSFKTVKTEFNDLDGLSWTRPVRRQSGTALATEFEEVTCLRGIRTTDGAEPKPPFVILTDADLASFAPEETIRASRFRNRLVIPPSVGRPSLPISKLPPLDEQSMFTHIECASMRPADALISDGTPGSLPVNKGDSSATPNPFPSAIPFRDEVTVDGQS